MFSTLISARIIQLDILAINTAIYYRECVITVFHPLPLAFKNILLGLSFSFCKKILHKKFLIINNLQNYFIFNNRFTCILKVMNDAFIITRHISDEIK